MLLKIIVKKSSLCKFENLISNLSWFIKSKCMNLGLYQEITMPVVAINLPCDIDNKFTRTPANVNTKSHGRGIVDTDVFNAAFGI